MKKLLVLLMFLVLAQYSYAQSVKLNEYDWTMTDVVSKGFTRQSFFDKMDRQFIKVGSSICSNRALLWANDFKRFYNIDSAKIFMFYTKKNGEVGRKTWWYHVAPIINESGKLWVVDAGFPGKIKGPQTKEEWLHSFIGSSNCKEIKSGENDLIERMFAGRVYPETTSYGTYDCYYRIAPGPFWTPATVAKNLLGVDENGKPIRFERHELNKDEIFQACVEATTSRLGRVFGNSRKACKELIEN